MEEEKVKGVLEWPTLKGVKDVQKFLELANYYRQFIKDFAAIPKPTPLHDIVNKDQKQDWMEKQEEIFRKLKERFTKEPVLVAPDLDKKIRMKVDTSDYTIEEILSMKCEDKRWRLVAFLSKSLNKTEKNYEIYDKKVLVVIRGLENQRHLLEGIKFKFEV